jgi:putative transposase
MFFGRPGHLRNFDYTGFHRYFLTLSTFQRRQLFTTTDVVSLVLLQFRRAAREESVAITGYCFMPDHVHLLLAGTSETADFLRFIRAAKQYSGFYYRQCFGGRLWQPDCYERVLHDEDGNGPVLRYILENPVRAGLAGEPLDYPFLGSDVHSTRQLGEFLRSADYWMPDKGGDDPEGSCHR